jgi:hypothetical protein
LAAPSHEIFWLCPYFEEKNYLLFWDVRHGWREREKEGERERRKMRVSWMMGVGVLIGYFSPHLI